MPKIIQLDIDPVEINKNVLITEEIIGDLKDVLKTLNKRFKTAESCRMDLQKNTKGIKKNIL